MADFQVRMLRWGQFPSGPVVRTVASIAGGMGLVPGSGRSWRRKWQPILVLLPGKSHGQRKLAGYSLLVSKEVDMI